MKKLIVVVLTLLSTNIYTAPIDNQTTNSYRNEFLALSTSEAYKSIFDPYPLTASKSLQISIENDAKLSYIQRLFRYLFLSSGAIILTRNMMPRLYTYIENICKNHNVKKVPTIFITTQKGHLNACAQKFLTSSGAILLEQDLLLQRSDEEVEAIVAHEMGHIKYNHINKTILTLILTSVALDMIAKSFSTEKSVTIINLPIVNLSLAGIITQLLIGKRFEKEADKFAYKNMGKGKGFIKFFSYFQNKEKNEANDFHSCFEKNKKQLYLLDRLMLKTSFYLDKISRWIYHNTPFGSHPSHQKRVEAAQTYLQTQI